MHVSERPHQRYGPLLEAVFIFVLIIYYIWRIRPEFPEFWRGIFALILFSHVYRRETAAALGFRWRNLPISLRRFSPILMGLAAVLVAAGVLSHTIRDVGIRMGFFSLVYYFFWGLFQQYLLNAYFVNRFLEYSSDAASSRVPILSALFFAGVHAPNWFLMIATGLGGYFCAKAYVRYRNLFFLGFAHGLIGFLLYLVAPDSISHHLYVGPKWFLH